MRLSDALEMGQAGEAWNAIGDEGVLVTIQQDGRHLAEVCHAGRWWDDGTFATLDQLEATCREDRWDLR
jgi:hypothetical protein